MTIRLMAIEVYDILSAINKLLYLCNYYTNNLYVLRCGNKNYLEYKLSLIYLIYLHLMNAQRKHSMIQVLLDFL